MVLAAPDQAGLECRRGALRHCTAGLDAVLGRPVHRRVAVADQPVGQDHPARVGRRAALERVGEVADLRSAFTSSKSRS